MSLSVRSRLTLSHLAVIIVAMGLSGILLLSLLERYFLEAMEESLVAQAHITAQALIPGAIAEGSLAAAPDPAFNTVQQQASNLTLQAQNVSPPASEMGLAGLDLSYLDQASLQLGTQLATRIRILDTSGRVLVDSRELERGTDLATDPLVRQALAGQQAVRVARAGSDSAIHLAMPIMLEDGLAGIVYLSQPLSDVAAVLHDLRTRWLLSTALALALSGLIGLWLSRAITRPLRRLTEAAGAVALGQLDQEVTASTRDELGQLSRAFNEMVARLRAARQMQLDFVANVSHELRTPLTAVKGLLETLRAGAIDDQEVRDRFLGTLEDETDRMIRLVNDLLLLSRADSAALKLKKCPVDLVGLAQVTTRRLAPQAERQQVAVRIEAEGTAHLALADPDRVEQVFMNLLDNAIKYSRPGGTVTVQVGAGPRATIQVKIQDQGIGIPAKVLDRIGERFYRADKARSRAAGGSGLGLAIARALVQAQGGNLSVESQEGQGTLVTFALPASGPAHAGGQA